MQLVPLPPFLPVRLRNLASGPDLAARRGLPPDLLAASEADEDVRLRVEVVLSAKSSTLSDSIEEEERGTRGGKASSFLTLERTESN